MEDLGLKVHVKLGFDSTREKLVELLKTEGFGVLTDINVNEVLKQKINVDFIRYEIIGACNPPLAYRALSANYEVGLLLPCNVILYEDGDGTTVNIMNPIVMVSMIQTEEVKAVATEAKSRLSRVYQALQNL